MGRLSTRYSPVRRSTQVPKHPFSLDLHVLGTPPAFILSQDQTLHFINPQKNHHGPLEPWLHYSPPRYSIVKDLIRQFKTHPCARGETSVSKETTLNCQEKCKRNKKNILQTISKSYGNKKCQNFQYVGNIKRTFHIKTR